MPTFLLPIFPQRAASLHATATAATSTATPASPSIAVPLRWHGVIMPTNAPNMPGMTQEQWEETVRWLARRYAVVSRPASRFPSARGVYLYAAETLPGWRTAFLPPSMLAAQVYRPGMPHTVYVSRRERTIRCTCALARQQKHLCGHVGAVLLCLLREEARE